MRLLAALTVILGALLLTSAAAALVINNGLAPPNPANVINTVIPEAVFVYDSGSGAPTTVELVDGGQIGDAAWERFEVYNSSHILMSGGLVWDDISSFGTSTVTITGGTINSSLLSYDSSTVTISGGSIAGAGLNPGDSSTQTVVGRNFAVDGTPVTFGLIEATNGTLTGIYPSGDAFSAYFRHKGYELAPVS
jgi:hypothetical protein